jgi:hypothetical protein
MREAAGWMRFSRASKSRPRGPAMTTSPSTTALSGREALSGSTSSGKYRVRGFSFRLPISTESPSRKTMARKPSHFGS